MTLKGTVTSVFCAVMLAFAPPALSKTPDGKTPAEEDICDPLRGATPGLYGLCVAYCEAHDADMISPSGDPNELNTPNQRILDNYNRKKKEADPPMPCVAVESCPCWTSAELQEMEPPSANYDFARYENACRKNGLSVTLVNFEFGSTGPNYQLSVYPREGCYVRKVDYFAGPSMGFSRMTAEEEESCRTLLIDHAREHSESGVVWDCFD